MNDINVQELINKYVSTWQQLFKESSSSESQDMYNDLFQCWGKIMMHSMESPEAWIKTLTGFYQDHFNLWLNMFNPAAEEVVQPVQGDWRFAAPDWEQSPLHNYLKQTYLLNSRWIMDKVSQSGLEDAEKAKCEFYTRQFVDAMSPSNFALTNPEVIKETLHSKGENLINGMKNFIQDFEQGRITMTDESAFELGRNIATTPGSVVFQNELIQLIQFKPVTQNVNEKPLLIVPPCINKYYVMDLSEHNSYVRYCLEQGNNVFIISWRNPDESMANVSWDDYIDGGTIPAINAVRSISGAKKINGVSWCIGGTMLATTMAVLAAKRKKPFASATFFTTLMDYSDPGELGVFINKAQVQSLEEKVSADGFMSGKQLASTFAMMRANDLVWSYVVNNYLKGKTPPPFDILYWNSDSTNMTAAMYNWYLRNLYLDNKLIEPGGVELCGVPVDLGKIDCPVYILSAIEDHIAPWKTTFVSTEVIKGPIQFVLGASGHIAGVINPATKNKRNFWMNGELGKGADHWLETAESVSGSWWPHWDEWLKSHGSKQVPAPEQLGGKNYPEIEAAPGSYVLSRLD